MHRIASLDKNLKYLQHFLHNQTKKQVMGSSLQTQAIFN